MMDSNYIVFLSDLQWMMDILDFLKACIKNHQNKKKWKVDSSSNLLIVGYWGAHIFQFDIFQFDTNIFFQGNSRHFLHYWHQLTLTKICCDLI